MTDRAAALTTTVGVIAGVHDRTADSRANTLMSGLTCLTDLDILMLKVADLTNGCLAVQADEANLTGRKSDLSHTVLFLRDELSCGTCGANQLTALAGVDLDVVNQSTNGNVSELESVTGLDICIVAGVNLVAVLQTDRSQNVGLVTLFVLKQSDVSGAVRVVLDTDNGCGRLVLTLEVNDSVLDLVTAASVANSDLAVAVTAGVLFLNLDQALFGSKLCDLLEGIIST